MYKIFKFMAQTSLPQWNLIWQRFYQLLVENGAKNGSWVVYNYDSIFFFNIHQVVFTNLRY